MNYTRFRPLPLLLLLAACATSSTREEPQAKTFTPQEKGALLAGRVVAVAYSPYRAGQRPGDDAETTPSDAQLLEDLQLLARDDSFTLLRLYDSGRVTARILRLIRDQRLPHRVMLGAWLNAEVSTHETCEWLTEPIPEEKLRANARENAAELDRSIALAREYPSIVVAVNVGNEVLVDWNDHRVSIEALLEYIARVKAAVQQPVTVADNYVPWTDHAALGGAVDFAAVHTYPIWEGRGIDEGLSFTVENLRAVQNAHPGLPIVIGEAGWATVASELEGRASEDAQTRYYNELLGWAEENHVTTFFFEAFDESWKGNPEDPDGAEKHWGLFDEQRRPKAVLRERYPDVVPGEESSEGG